MMFSQLWIRNRRRPVYRDKSLANDHKRLDTSPSTMPHVSSSPTTDDNMAISSPLCMNNTTTDQIKTLPHTSQLTGTHGRYCIA